MAVEVHSFPVTIPAATITPLTFNLPIPLGRVVREVRVQVPPGPRGEVGWALGTSGVQVYPRLSGTYVVTDDWTEVWNLEQAIDSGAWQMIAYNTGAVNHTIYVRFLVDLDDQARAPIPAPISSSELSSAPVVA